MDLIDNGAVDYYIAEKPLELVNGDTGFISIEEKQLFVGIVDGAGHGPEAHRIARDSRDFLEYCPVFLGDVPVNTRDRQINVLAEVGQLEHLRTRKRF